MKYLAATLALIFWMITTIILACSIIGITAILYVDEYRKIPIRLLKAFES